MHVLTKYQQLLLYTFNDKNNLYKFVASMCFLVPMTIALSMHPQCKKFIIVRRMSNFHEMEMHLVLKACLK